MTELQLTRENARSPQTRYYTLWLAPSGTQARLTQNHSGHSNLFTLPPGTRLVTGTAAGPPVPGVTINAGYTVYAVLPGSIPGSTWYVAAEDAPRGFAVTWECHAGMNPGRLTFYWGHHFGGPGQDNRKAALADLARRAGIDTSGPPF